MTTLITRILGSSGVVNQLLGDVCRCVARLGMHPCLPLPPPPLVLSLLPKSDSGIVLIMAKLVQPTFLDLRE